VFDVLSIKDLDLRPLASVSAFSDALLERYPTVLDQFLEKALESDETEVCSFTLGNC
jgi:hypothetical protein